MTVTRHVTATAPVRVADVGGWTDTWFAGHGTVFSIAVEPLVTVRVTSGGRDDGPHVFLDAPDVDAEPYGFDLDALPGRQPLLEAAVAEGAATATRLDIEVTAGVPAGCATGTSGAVVVALLAALDADAGRPRPAPADLARRAHQVETERLGLQSGVQDQLAAAYGGINRFDVRYPEAFAHPIRVPPAALVELGRRLVLVYLGHPHRSSAVHEEVIAGLGGAAAEHPALERLRRAALAAGAAASDGDFAALGRAMVEATEAQRSLHGSLVSEQAEALLAIAATHGAAGWKVNGAGGDGGSLTLIAGPRPADTGRLLEAMAAAPGPHHVVPIRLAPAGVRVSVEPVTHR